MTIQETEKAAEQSASTDAAAASEQKPTRATEPVKSAKSGTKTKQEQLVTLLSKPNGARISTIIKKLGWQAHTVRAAVSGLRKQGHEVVTSKAAKTGELVYAINAKPMDDEAATAEAAS